LPVEEGESCIREGWTEPWEGRQLRVNVKKRRGEVPHRGRGGGGGEHCFKKKKKTHEKSLSSHTEKRKNAEKLSV